MISLNIPGAVYIYNEGIKSDFKTLKKFIQTTFGSIRVSRINLKKEAVATRGLLFDFVGTQKAFTQLEYSKVRDACHIVLTKKIFATLGENEQPHIRAAVFGWPSVISTSGIVEGPAKPKEYYLFKQKYAQLGIWDIEEPKIKKRFKGRFIGYEDKRMTEALKGYIAQALFFYITGEPFCKEKACRLFNSHWQEDLIYSQIKGAKFCRTHKNALKNIRKNI